MIRPLRWLVLASATHVAAPTVGVCAQESRPVIEQATLTERLGNRLPLELAFRDEQGRDVRLADSFSDVPVVLVPADYDCRMLCPFTLQHLDKGLRASGLAQSSDYRVVVIGIDPRDGVASAQHAAHRLAGRNWTFLTGDDAAIRSITSAIGFGFAYDPATDQYAHPAAAVVLTPDARVASYLYGIDVPGRTVRRALSEAKAGRTISALDRVLLRCYRYIPALRRHEGLIRGILMTGGLLTILAVALTIAGSMRRSLPAVALVQADAGRGMQDFLEAVNTFYRTLLGLPEQASTIAWQIDALHYFEISTMWTAAGVIGTVATYYVIRYRRRPGHFTTPRVTVSLTGELGLFSGLLALFVLFWAIGFRQFKQMGLPPDNALDVYVTAKQWIWKFSYPTGPASVGVLYVPAGRPVRLNLTSRDVIHSFFVPEFRIKRDAVPGMYTSIWFEAIAPGRYPILCTEFCGTGHSMMLSEVVVLRAEEYDDWISGRAPAQPARQTPFDPEIDAVTRLDNSVRLADFGRDVAARHGCLGCHTLDGTRHIGPTWLGLYSRWEELTTGERIYVNEAYITESMMDPQAKIVAGFAPVMPSFLGQVTPAETAAIIELLKALAHRPGRQ